jgi:hypothetical protein
VTNASAFGRPTTAKLEAWRGSQICPLFKNLASFTPPHSTSTRHVPSFHIHMRTDAGNDALKIPHRAELIGNGFLSCPLISHLSHLRKQTNQLLLLRDTQEVSLRARCQCHVLCPGIFVGWSVDAIHVSAWKAFIRLQDQTKGPS